ncbi:MAG: hypothetical protein H6Q90_2101 [Deltaproteobacteria bacterium]|nr:hypothetical protein [Deltaproteobacteria bacterium]
MNAHLHLVVAGLGLLACSPAGRNTDTDAGGTEDPDGSTPATCTHATQTTYLAGPDGMVGTNDDVIGSTLEIEFAPGPPDAFFRAHPIKFLYKEASGHPTQLTRWAYDAHGHRQTVTQYGPGPDETYDTGDDVVVGQNVFTSDTSGLLVSNLFRTSAGPNEIWGDADDLIVNAIRFTHADGRVDWVLPANDPGTDGVWGNDDDRPSSSERLRYDAQGRRSAVELYSQTGPDTKFGTDDDIMGVRMVLPCRGDRVVQELYDSPGHDGAWGSTDDTISGRVIESGDLCESATCEPTIF